MTVETGVRTIALDRRICVAREGRIDVRPSPGAFIDRRKGSVTF